MSDPVWNCRVKNGNICNFCYMPKEDKGKPYLALGTNSYLSFPAVDTPQMDLCSNDFPFGQTLTWHTLQELPEVLMKEAPVLFVLILTYVFHGQ